MAKILSLFNIQKTIRELGDEVTTIERQIHELDKNRFKLKRQLNSINSGITYLERLEKDTINMMEKKKKKSKGKK